MSHPSPGEIPLPFKLSRMVASLWVPQAIYVAAALGIPDLLAKGPMRSAEIARVVEANPDAVHRLMRALVVLEIATQSDDGTFALAALGECLRSDTRDSMRAWALLWGGDLMWPRWGHMLDSIRTGISAPQLLDGRERFDDIAAHPAEQVHFYDSMMQLTRQIAGALVMSYDFAWVSHVVDVGGGYGQLLPPILAANPAVRATVFDLPDCRAGALRLFEKTGLAERMSFVAGDMFEGVPPGADLYLLKSVIHDWDDERSIAILRSCRAAMGANARLLILEWLMPERVSPSDQMIVGTDLNMLVMVGGRERTDADYRALASAAGLEVARIVPTPAGMSIIETVAA